MYWAAVSTVIAIVVPAVVLWTEVQSLKRDVDDLKQYYKESSQQVGMIMERIGRIDTNVEWLVTLVTQTDNSYGG